MPRLHNGLKMRIISKFHDYYDIGMSHGQDQTLIYHRVPTVSKSKASYFCDVPIDFEEETSANILAQSHANALSYQRIVVGFCGKVYQCYVMGADVTPYHQPSIRITSCCYNALGVKNFIDDYGAKETIKSFYSKPHPWRTDSLKYSIIQRRFDEWKTDKYFDEFIKLKAPVFVVDRCNMGREIRMTINLELTTFQFYKVVDPYTAYQEIAMFIGGVLGVGEPFMIEIEDKYKRDAKGFNDQSFKTRPGTKPNRKNKKDK